MTRWIARIAFATLLSWPAAGAETWTRVTVPGVELYTTAGGRQAKDLLQRLEQVRSFFLKASPVRKLSEVPLRIIEFRTPEEFKDFNPSKIAAAYYTSTPSMDYIVLGPTAEENFGIVVHEYVHLIVRHSGLRLPIWLNEGWADVYSTLRAQGKETAVGDLISSRMQSLMKDEWLDFDTLTSVTASSPNYNESSRAGIFYAESWALTHMLYLAPDYQDKFGVFLSELNAGKSADAACRSAWGRSGGEVFEDLKKYFNRKKILGRIYDSRLEKVREEAQEQGLDEFERGMMLADLMAADGNLAGAKTEFERLDRETPGKAAVAQALGGIVARMGDEDAARQYYEKAFDAGSKDAVMCFNLAVLEQKKGQTAKVLAPATRAVSLRPGYTEAEILMGLTQLDLRNFEGAAMTLLAIEEVRPEVAPAIFCGLAVAFLQTADFDAARSHLATCRKWAKTEVQVKRADQVAAFLEARAKPEAAVRKGEKHGVVVGTAIAMDCDVTGPRLRVRVGEQVASFDLPAPAAVELAQANGGQLQLRCGVMPPVRVSVEFAPPRTAIGTSTGIVRRLEF